MDMERIIVNDITLGQIVAGVAAAAVLLAIVKLYRAFFRKKKVNLQHMVYFVCDHCGWEGHVSKFGTRCPKCDSAAGDGVGGPA